MTAPRLTAGPAAPAAKPNAGLTPPAPRPGSDPGRSASPAMSRFAEVLNAAQPLHVASPAGEPSSPETQAGERIGRIAAGTPTPRGSPVQSERQRGASPNAPAYEGDRREARPPAPASPADAPAPDGPRLIDVERLPPDLLAETPAAAARRPDDVAEIAALLASSLRKAAAPVQQPVPRTPIAQVLSSIRSAPQPIASGPGEIDAEGSPPPDLRISRLAATVARLETHFAPVRPPSLTPPERKAESGRHDAIGLFEQVRAALDISGDPIAGETRPTAPAPPAAPATHPVRVLEIALQPAALGSLTVTFRLTGTGTLKVTVNATERETATILEEDAEALAAIVSDAGYAVDEVTVIHAPHS